MDVFRIQELIGLILAVSFLAWQVRGEITTLAAATWGYFLVSAARVENVNRLVQGKKILHVGHSSSTALILLLLIPLVVLSLTKRQRLYAMAGFACLLFLNLPWLVSTIGPGRMAHGLFDCESFDAGIMAAVLPVAVVPFTLVAPRWRSIGLEWLSFLVPILAAVFTNTTTPFYVLASLFAAAGIFYSKGRYRLAALLCVGMFLGLGALFAANGIFNTSGRIAGYKFFMSWWAENGSFLWGTGGGTFQYLGTLIQMSKPGIDPNVWGGWLWLHNDWLQVLFEYGAVGFILLTATYLSALVKAYSRPWLFTGLISYGILALAQFPTHWVLTQFWAALLLREAFQRDPEARIYVA